MYSYKIKTQFSFALQNERRQLGARIATYVRALTNMQLPSLPLHQLWPKSPTGMLVHNRNFCSEEKLLVPYVGLSGLYLEIPFL